ncbi:hypothetical protein [Actinocatenispora thailandica]|uniref:hypothetical protein n=1 Tax=Actinocatenispora thailandica TaxID=227318 RepID=UPI00195116D6|nr:hypothetical protein [Actinocatenispora thailandica]
MDTPGPLVFVEEVRRFPPWHRHPSRPGLALVYESAAGRLSAPAGGYTPGELWWRRPRRVYGVDLTRQRLQVTATGSDGEQLRVSGVARVHDPVAVVAARSVDGWRDCRDHLAALAHRPPAERDATWESGDGIVVTDIETSPVPGPAEAER